MVIYYSWTGNTKAYAEALAAKKGLPLFELKEKAARGSGKLDFIKAIFQIMGRKETLETEVTALPELSSCNEIFVCSPVWADTFTPSVRTFLNHAGLTNKKVHFLFTCAAKNVSSQGFQKSAAKFLKGKDCIAGEMYAFSMHNQRPLNIEKVKNDIDVAIK